MSSEFKFNFGLPAVDDEADDNIQVSDTHKLNKSQNYSGCGGDASVSFKQHAVEIIKYLPTIRKLIKAESLGVLHLMSNEVENSGPSSLWYLNQESVYGLLEASEPGDVTANLCELMKHSDLRSGVYEGGFKIWECSIDLVKFLASDNANLQDKDVLELGCGAGLPALYCLVCGANFVCFQDFNEEVINYFTVPNIICNLKQQSPHIDDTCLADLVNRKTLMLSGDWVDVCTCLKTNKKKFDLILSSETIYNTENYEKLHKLLCDCLKENGLALLANKSYYFGVGGSSKDFIEYIEQQGKLAPKIVHQVDKGVNREIVQVKWKQ
ncbi:histidine protein methyltransferase 1 homolog [Rhopilema esculentum]|uniref:histidine protein methyltransferase 1 homolog n=1 Tax=Rhopilema esculentum TaxID=499914 RepID=UPI0031E36AD7|eukprot:gene4809-21122_t